VFWLGLYPGLTEAMIQYTAETVTAFASRARSSASLTVL
jgi:hypothetical protein